MTNCMESLVSGPEKFSDEEGWKSYVRLTITPMVNRMASRTDTVKDGEGRYLYTASDGVTEFNLIKTGKCWAVAHVGFSEVPAWARMTLREAKISAEAALWSLYQVKDLRLQKAQKRAATENETENWMGEGGRWF